MHDSQHNLNKFEVTKLKLIKFRKKELQIRNDL